jgi:hypothetical protein
MSDSEIEVETEDRTSLMLRGIRTTLRTNEAAMSDLRREVAVLKSEVAEQKASITSLHGVIWQQQQVLFGIQTAVARLEARPPPPQAPRVVYSFGSSAVVPSSPPPSPATVEAGTDEEEVLLESAKNPNADILAMLERLSARVDAVHIALPRHDEVPRLERRLEEIAREGALPARIETMLHEIKSEVAIADGERTSRQQFIDTIMRDSRRLKRERNALARTLADD